MKVISLYRTQRGSDCTDVILLTKDRTLMRQVGTTLKVCKNCAIRDDLCNYGSSLCGTRGYFIDIKPTEEIEDARNLLVLKGELL